MAVRVFLWILESYNKVSEFKMASNWIQHGRIQDGSPIIKLSQNEWSEVYSVQNTLNPKMAEFKMAAIIKLRSEWMSLSQIELVY